MLERYKGFLESLRTTPKHFRLDFMIHVYETYVRYFRVRFLCVWLFYVNFLHVEVKCVSRKKPKIRLNIFLSNGTCHLDNMVLLTSNDITSILRAKRISKEILSGKICGGVRNCFSLDGRVEGRDCTPFSYKLNAAINFVKIICRFFQTFNDKRRPFSPNSVCFLRGPRWLVRMSRIRTFIRAGPNALLTLKPKNLWQR